MRCLNCKTKFTPIRFLQKFCTSEICIDASIIYAKEKVKSNNQKKWKAEKKELKEKLKTLSDFKKDLQVEINTIIRTIDEGYPCIATGTLEGKRNAGHYIGTKANPTIRFHLENIWIQSEHSNMWQSGDTLRYQQGIIKTFGSDYLDYMNSLQQTPLIRLTADDIKERISIARGIIKWLKLQNRQFTVEERISLRKEFNKKIGIYS